MNSVPVLQHSMAFYLVFGTNSDTKGYLREVKTAKA